MYEQASFVYTCVPFPSLQLSPLDSPLTEPLSTQLPEQEKKDKERSWEVVHGSGSYCPVFRIWKEDRITPSFVVLRWRWIRLTSSSLFFILALMTDRWARKRIFSLISTVAHRTGINWLTNKWFFSLDHWLTGYRSVRLLVIRVMLVLSSSPLSSPPVHKKRGKTTGGLRTGNRRLAITAHRKGTRRGYRMWVSFPIHGASFPTSYSTVDTGKRDKGL